MKLKDFLAIAAAGVIAAAGTLASVLLAVDAARVDGMVDVSVVQAAAARGAILGLLFGVAAGVYHWLSGDSLYRSTFRSGHD